MIDLQKALKIAEESYPNGPEALAAAIGAQVEYSPLIGCEGWCIRGDDRIVIRINSTSTEGRQRFTLAHEIAHIILYSTPDVWSVDIDHIEEEQTVNQIAAELLLPERIVFDRFGKSGVISKSEVESLALEAKVSEVMAARRIVGLSRVLGIDVAIVADFNHDGSFRWMIPSDVIETAFPASLLAKAKQATNGTYSYSVPGFEVSAYIFTTVYSDSVLIQAKRVPLPQARPAEAVS